jgi:cation transport ATPase
MVCRTISMNGWTGCPLRGLTAFVVRRDGDLVGVVAVSDRVRPGAEGTVRRLGDMDLGSPW